MKMLKEVSLSNSRFYRREGQKKAAMTASGPIFELKNFRIPSRSAKHWAAVLGSLSSLCRGVGRVSEKQICCRSNSRFSR